MDTIHIVAVASRCAARRRGDFGFRGPPEIIILAQSSHATRSRCLCRLDSTPSLSARLLGSALDSAARLGRSTCHSARLFGSASVRLGGSAAHRRMARRPSSSPAHGSAARWLGSARLGGSAARRHPEARRLNAFTARGSTALVCCAASTRRCLTPSLAARRAPSRASAAAYALCTTARVGIAVRVAAASQCAARHLRLRRRPPAGRRIALSTAPQHIVDGIDGAAD